MEYLQAIMITVLFAFIIAIIAVAFYRIKENECPACDAKEKRIKVSDRNPESYNSCVRLSVSGMTCAHCKRKVENALNAKGTVWAEVDLKEGTALVRMKEALPDDTLRRIVSRAGYTVVGIEQLS